MNNLTLLIKPASGLCNMNCGYCFYKAARQGRESGIMTDETADMLLGKIKAYRPSSLTVMFQGGEPTLAGLDFFKSFVRKVKENAVCPVSFALQTNGTLIDDDFASFFKTNDFLTGVSLDGARITNDRYRCGSGDESTFDKVLSGISVLKKHGADFNILSVIDDRSADDIESTWSFFKEQGLSFLQFIPCLDEGCGVSLSAEKYEAFLRIVGKDPIRKHKCDYILPGGLVLECSLVDEGIENEFMYAEVEFPSVEEAEAFEVPPYLGKEVTYDRYWKMNNYWKRTRLGDAD